MNGRPAFAATPGLRAALLIYNGGGVPAVAGARPVVNRVRDRFGDLRPRLISRAVRFGSVVNVLFPGYRRPRGGGVSLISDKIITPAVHIVNNFCG